VFGVWVASVLGAVLAVIVVDWLIWGITRSALTIDEYADAIIATAVRILENTAPLVAVESTVAAGVELLNTVKAIEADGAAILANTTRLRLLVSVYGAVVPIRTTALHIDEVAGAIAGTAGCAGTVPAA